MAVKILFFAKLRDLVGQAEFVLTQPNTPCPASEVIAQLPPSIKKIMLALPDGDVRCAINQQMAKLADSVADGDEVAFFPPVTGG